MILVLNCGSQSIKWKLFDGSLELKKEGSVRVFGSRSYEKALIAELAKLKQYQGEVKIIGHRFVHGGSKFSKPTVIKKDNLKKLEELNKLAPLHNPFNILGVKFSQGMFPRAKQVAVFDTEFFFDLPEKASTYPIPLSLRQKYGIKKFGFHGISHEYAAREAAEIFKRPFQKLKIITCHLGGGSSIAAINKGQAIETSMGFTPLGGLVMMTRPGDIDPGVIAYLSEKVKNINDVLNYESGLKAISGFDDMKDTLAAVKKGNKKAKFALDIYTYNIQKHIGAYYAILGGCDLIAFTGAIGSGSTKVVNMICKDMLILKNTRVLSIKTNEEVAIGKKIWRIK